MRGAHLALAVNNPRTTLVMATVKFFRRERLLFPRRLRGEAQAQMVQLVEAEKAKSGETKPRFEEAAGRSAEGAVSARHDPLDAIEEAVHDGDFHEIIISTLPKHISHWLHSNLPHRAEHLGLPITTVTAAGCAS